MQPQDVLELCVDVLEDQLYMGHVRGPCPYLPDRDQALMLLDGRDVGKVYRLMLDRGYRRHGQHVYRPDCSACRQCRVLRIITQEFQPTRSQRRVWRKAQGRLRFELNAPLVDRQRLEMYTRYLAFQHADDAESEAPTSATRYREFFVESFLGDATRELRILDGDRLIGVGIVDLIGDAISSVYFYFDPEYARFSPGVYSTLCELQIARELGLRYYYPGYYIRDCAAMSYKARFGPNEVREVGGREWRRDGAAIAAGPGDLQS